MFARGSEQDRAAARARRSARSTCERVFGGAPRVREYEVTLELDLGDEPLWVEGLGAPRADRESTLLTKRSTLQQARGMRGWRRGAGGTRSAIRVRDDGWESIRRCAITSSKPSSRRRHARAIARRHGPRSDLGPLDRGDARWFGDGAQRREGPRLGLPRCSCPR